MSIFLFIWPYHIIKNTLQFAFLLFLFSLSGYLFFAFSTANSGYGFHFSDFLSRQFPFAGGHIG